jgi:hypothetical protein
MAWHANSVERGLSAVGGSVKLCVAWTRASMREWGLLLPLVDLQWLGEACRRGHMWHR